mmetsp:Transcript_89831/g.267992  ORF Transcript_89831/g.267992 Transcript_89831/m.267992 type:complete len:242 (-) Transcript_89831:309-1034(-)
MLSLPPESRGRRTKPMHARGPDCCGWNGPPRRRMLGCTRLMQHSVISEASTSTPAHGAIPLPGRWTGSRASCHSLLQILQIVQCANSRMKSSNAMKNTCGLPPSGQPNRIRSSGVQRALESDHSPSHLLRAWGLRIFSSRTISPFESATSCTSSKEYTWSLSNDREWTLFVEHVMRKAASREEQRVAQSISGSKPGRPSTTMVQGHPVSISRASLASPPRMASYEPQALAKAFSMRLAQSC